MNKQIKKSLLLIIVVLTIMSCSVETDTIVEIQLSEVEPLPLERKIVNVDLYFPFQIYLYKDKLIIYDNMQDSLFKVFNRKNLEYKYTFGRIGQGPDDFIFIDPKAINSSNYFEILDRNELRYYDITDTGAFQVFDSKFVSHKSGPINNFRKLSDSIYLFDNGTQTGKFEKELILYNVNNKTDREIGDLMFFEAGIKNKSIEEQSWSLVKSITVNVTHNKFALFYSMHPVFKIFSSNVLTNIFHIDNIPHREGNVYFSEAYSTDKFLYVLWVAQPVKEIMENQENFKPGLLVFDWNGNLVKNYKFDIPVVVFAVNNNDDTLYAISCLESDMNAIYVCNLNI